MEQPQTIHLHGEYIGFQDYLRGKFTMVQLRSGEPGWAYCQFDDIDALPVGLTHGWTRLLRSDLALFDLSIEGPEQSRYAAWFGERAQKRIASARKRFEERKSDPYIDAKRM